MNAFYERTYEQLHRHTKIAEASIFLVLACACLSLRVHAALHLSAGACGSSQRGAVAWVSPPSGAWAWVWAGGLVAGLAEGCAGASSSMGAARGAALGLGRGGCLASGLGSGLAGLGAGSGGVSVCSLGLDFFSALVALAALAAFWFSQWVTAAA